MQVHNLLMAEEISKAFDAFLELRPSLKSLQSFVNQVIEQQKEGYKLAAILENDEVVACMGFRIMNMLAWGKILYIDDLITKESFRGKGYGKTLLDYAAKVARDNGCNQVHLDTGYARHAAHKIYLNYGFQLICHHLALKLE